jgi:drug/metabolite transporter (DMT)-like permease
MRSGVSRPTTVRGSAAAARDRAGLVTGLLSGALWGAAAVILAEALTRRPLARADALYAAPLVVAALHDCFAAVWVSAVNAAGGKLRSVAAALRTRDGLVIAAAALLGGPLAMSTYLLAIDFAGASYAVAVSAVFPALGALLGRLVLRDRLRAPAWAGIMLAVVGAAVASYAPPAGASSHYVLGTLCAAVSAVGWAAEGVMVTHAMSRLPALVALNIRELVSAASYLCILLPVFGIAGLAGRALVAPSVGLLLAASIAGAGAYLAYYRSLALIGPARAMPPNSTYVLWTIGLSLAVTGEPPGWRLVLGGLVVVAGITLVASFAGQVEAGPAAVAEAQASARHVEPD